MAGNEGERGRRLNRILQIAREEEDINRQLKALGMYDDSSTFEERKQILEAIKESEQLAAGHSPLVTGRSQRRINGMQIRKENTTPSSVYKKSFRLLSSDSENSDSADFEVDKTTFPPLKVKAPSEKTDAIDLAADLAIPRGRTHVKPPVNSYAAKVYEAALKKNSTSKKAENSIVLLEQNNPPKSLQTEPKEVHQLLLNSDSSDENLTCPEVLPLKPVIIDVLPTSTASNNPSKKPNMVQIKKSKLTAMKSTVKKYSKFLTDVQKMKAEPLPETFDFNCTNSYELLLAREQSLRKAQLANGRSVDFGKLINLSSLNGKKLRPTSKLPGISNLSPMRINTETDPFETNAMFDSPSVSHKQQMNSIINSLESPMPMPRSVSLEPLVNSDEDFEFDSNPKHIPKSFGASEISRTKAETVDCSECPICNKPFPTSTIESHAAGCYNYLGDEEPRENPSRSTRSSVRQNHGESSRADVYILPEGKTRTTPTDELDPYEIKYSDSDTEIDDQAPNKRSRRRDMNKGKKRRF